MKPAAEHDNREQIEHGPQNFQRHTSVVPEVNGPGNLQCPQIERPLHHVRECTRGCAGCTTSPWVIGIAPSFRRCRNSTAMAPIPSIPVTPTQSPPPPNMQFAERNPPPM